MYTLYKTKYHPGISLYSIKYQQNRDQRLSVVDSNTAFKTGGLRDLVMWLWSSYPTAPQAAASPNKASTALIVHPQAVGSSVSVWSKQVKGKADDQSKILGP